MGRTPMFNKTDLLLSHELADGGQQADAAGAERAEPLQPEDGAARVQLPEPRRWARRARRPRSTSAPFDLYKGYDYNALIRATPDGANAYDPRYGMDDLFEAGTQGQVSVKFLF